MALKLIKMVTLGEDDTMHIILYRFQTTEVVLVQIVAMGHIAWRPLSNLLIAAATDDCQG